MEQSNNKFFKNRGLKRVYIVLPIITAIVTILFGFIVPGARGSAFFFVTYMVFFIFFILIQKYEITSDNTIELYGFFWRFKNRSILIESISEIVVKPRRLSLDYRKEGVSRPISFDMELNDVDMKTIVDELLKRNPTIVVS